MTRSMNRALVILASAIALASCDSNEPLAPSDVVGDTWRLVWLQETGSSIVVVDDPSRYTLQFGSDGRLAVRSDCNSCGGPYTLTGASLEVGPLACTRAFCGDASLDSRYTGALDRARSVARTDNEMTIQAGNTILRLRK